MSKGLVAFDQAAFVDLAPFERGLPLQSLLTTRPDLFIAKDGTDPLDDLMKYLGYASRSLTAENFIAHNDRQLNMALQSILKSSNDVVVTAILVDPFGTLDPDFLYPITDLITDYLRVKRSPCLIDFLPLAFQDEAVYNTYFTQLEGYVVIPNEKEGFKAIVHDEIGFHTRLSEDASWKGLSHNGQISVAFSSRYFIDSKLIDIRGGCAVSINQPFEFGGFTLIDRWLMLHNQDTRQLHIWRSDSRVPILVDVLKPYYTISTGARSVCILTGLEEDLPYVYLPTDTSVPLHASRFESTAHDALIGEFSDAMFQAVMIVETETIAFVSEEVVLRAQKYARRLYHSLTTVFNTSMNEIKDLVRLQVDGLYDFIDCLNASTKYREDAFKVFRKARILCMRLGLCSVNEVALWMHAVVTRRVTLEVDSFPSLAVIP